MHLTIGGFRGSESFDDFIKTFGVVTDYKRIIHGISKNTKGAAEIRTKSSCGIARGGIIDTSVCVCVLTFVCVGARARAFFPMGDSYLEFLSIA